MSEADPSSIDAFIRRWAASGAAERANYQLFLSELCDVLEVPRPEPQAADDAQNGYVFEKAVPLPHGTTGRIDLYKRDCFVLEAKQGSDGWDGDQTPSSSKTPSFSKKLGVSAARRRRGTATRGTSTWDTAMERAREQAQRYARNLPPAELAAAGSGGGRPPFVIVVDVGATIELYSEFTRTGGAYLAFPDPQHHRIRLEELRDPDVRALLATVWTEPMSLDPARRSARVTRTIAAQLAALARSLEGSHPADAVAHFLMRCLFTMFAEDVGLLPNRSFTQLLADLRHDVASFPPMVEHLWRTMDTGGFSVILRTQIPRFNGDLFAEANALPLTSEQLALLMEAARADWRDVEPAIFGTLLERALDPVERHKLGAHYTPRAYVERLVVPTVVEPLRQEWDSVKTAALLLQEQGQNGLAITVVEEFLRKLAHLRVLDPACGSANFLYVTMEHLKRLEAEVLHVLRELGQAQMTLEMESIQVTPQQFLGIEINPRAAAIAELVLWIGFLQWHFRTRGDVQPAEPIVRAFHNIECRDAVLAWESVEPLLDGDGASVTRWDGRTMKRHPVTGEEVPDERARVPVMRYINPRPAVWPQAEIVVGNPPFIGTARMREALGDGYTEAIRSVYPHVPDSADYVMFWWDKAAELVRAGDLERFGLITTNSLRQTFNRRVLEYHMQAEPPLSLRFAIPDHPWVDTADGAAVRIAMTVASAGVHSGTLLKVTSESDGANETEELTFVSERGKIFADLTIVADVAAAVGLRANEAISSRGTQLFGAGFIVTPEEAAELGYETDDALAAIIKPYRNGRDLTQTSRNVLVIDLFGLSEQEARDRYPAVYQWVYERVKPERDQNRRASYRDRWWIHGEPRASFRPALVGLDRYIATVETSKHRFFVFLDHSVLPDNMLIAVALEDAYHLGVLSSRIHVTWALAAGGRLGVGNDPRYNKSRCFEPYPFPDASEAQRARIRELGERLDAHRKRQQARHPSLTLTEMYNVLERLRALEAADANLQSPNLQSPPLTAKERTIHDQGLVAVLKQIHDDLDAAVAETYGWPADLPDGEILQRLVDLNARRAAEEAAGVIRWLRPEYQQPRAGIEPVQPALVEEVAAAPAAGAALLAWPASMPEQARAVRGVLGAAGVPLSAAEVAARFVKAEKGRVAELLETLVLLGQAGESEGKFGGV